MAESEENERRPARDDIDPVAFALERVQTMLTWIEEHRVSYEAVSDSDPRKAREEWSHLADAIQQARKHHRHLIELILAGQGIDPTMKMPRGFGRP